MYYRYTFDSILKKYFIRKSFDFDDQFGFFLFWLNAY